MRGNNSKSFLVRLIHSISSKLPKNKRVRTGLLAAVLVISSTIYIFNSRVHAAVTMDTSTVASATQYSFQRKTWHDGTNYWSAFYSGSEIEFWHSADGSSWSQNTTVTSPANTADFSIEADGSNMYIAYGITGGSVYVRKAVSYPDPGGAFTLSSATLVFTGGLPPSYSNVSLSKDSNSKIRIMAKKNNTNNSYVSKLSTSADDISAFGGEEAVSTLSANSNKYGVVSSLGSSNMYSVWIDGTIIEGKKNTSGTWDANSSQIATGTTGTSNNMSMVSNTALNEAYLTYIDSNGKNIFQKYVDKQGGDGVKIDDAGDPGGILGSGRNLIRTSSGTLYSFINDGGSCEIWKSTDGSSWTEQDDTHNPTCTNATAVAMAIDTTDKLHLAYFNSTSPCGRYITMTGDTFGSPENLPQLTGPTSACMAGLSINIAIDSANIPHVVQEYITTGNDRILYTNRLGGGGTWNAAVLIESAVNLGGYASLTVNEDDIPEVSFINTTDTDVTAAVGDANNATSFTLKDVELSPFLTAGTVGTDIGVDSSGNTWVAYTYDPGGGDPVIVAIIKHNDGDAWSTWQSRVLGETGKEPSLAISGTSVKVLYQDASDDIAMASYVGGGNMGQGNKLKTGTFSDASVRWGYNANNKNSPLDFLYSDGTDIFYSNTGLWNVPVTIDSNSGNEYTSITRKTDTGDLYNFWIRGDDTYYSVASSPYTSWSSPTALYTTGTNDWLSSASTSSTNKVPYMFTSGTGSPYDVKWDSISFNAPPTAPTITSPNAGVTLTSTTPTFQISSTDAESDTIKYQVYIDNSGALDGMGGCLDEYDQTYDQQGSGTGWDNGTTAYASGATATYTIQTPLTRGATYCWQAQSIDPLGSDSYSDLTAPRLFTINDDPNAPTLTQPANGATGQGATPEFRLSTTDADSDYLQYKIEFCTVNTWPCVNGSLITKEQSADQTGWSSKNASSGSAYSSGQSAVYAMQTALAVNTTYYWRAYAKDPAGSNTYSSVSSVNSFATQTTAPPTVNIRGNVNIGGGVIIKP